MFQFDLKSFNEDLKKVAVDSDVLSFLKDEGFSDSQINMCMCFFKLGVAMTRAYLMRNVKESNNENL